MTAPLHRDAAYTGAKLELTGPDGADRADLNCSDPPKSGPCVGFASYLALNN
jgi:hypothetical protein